MELIVKGIPGSLRQVYEELCIRLGDGMWAHNYNTKRDTIANIIANVQKQMNETGMECSPEQLKGIKGELLFVRGLDSIIEDNEESDKGLDKARLLHSVQIKSSQRKERYEPDHIYVDQRGIWVIETKQWKKIPREDHWNYRKKQPEGYIKEAVEQAAKYPEIIAEFLGFSEDRIIPVIFDWNGAFDDYKLGNVKHVTTATSFYERIVQKSDEHYSPIEVEQISSKLEKEIRPVMNNRVLASMSGPETW